MYLREYLDLWAEILRGTQSGYETFKSGVFSIISTDFGPTQSWVEKAEHQAFKEGGDKTQGLSDYTIRKQLTSIIIPFCHEKRANPRIMQ